MVLHALLYTSRPVVEMQPPPPTCVAAVDQRSSSPTPAPEFRQHGIIWPRLFHGREKRSLADTRQDGGLHVHDLIVGYDFGGSQHVLDLRLNRELIPDTYFEKHHRNGKHVVNRPSGKDVELCHYQGTLRDHSNSWAAVSTCQGLRGMVYDGNELLYIEPIHTNATAKNASDDGQFGAAHIYRHSDLTATNLTCGVKDDVQKIQSKESLDKVFRFKRSGDSSGDYPDVRGPYNSNKYSRYVELVLVVDNLEYKQLDEDLRRVHKHCKDIANIINALYVPLNIYIALVGVVVWSDHDEIYIDTNGDKTLTNFLHYRQVNLINDHPNDNAQLLTRVQFDGGVVGKALKGPMCTYEFSGGVNMDHSNVVGLVATTVAHEMGHNFGMEHDASNCQCPDERCIMSPASSQISPTHWSSCSLEHLLMAFEHGMDYCLRNKPKRLFDSPVCGNGFVEPGEQCDCGLKDQCNNPCCNALTCMLHRNASCATGECCDLSTCRPKNAGTLCRSADHECDLPEYCSGRSEYCPDDVFRMDGQPCKQGQAYCYHGSCRTQSDQCILLWGPSGKTSDAQCFKTNTKGTRHGNCGYDRKTGNFTKCADEDVKCGMLHCKHLNERLEFGMESAAILSHTFINSNGNVIACRTAVVDLGLNEIDPGLVPDGSKCGVDKMCVNQNCVPVSSVQRTVCPENCNGKGVCNSKGQCHCKQGFAPPLCKYPGPGGSEHSGPATDTTANQQYINALYIIFLGIVPFMVLTSIAMFYARPHIKHWFEKPGRTKGAPRHMAKGNGIAHRGLHNISIGHNSLCNAGSGILVSSGTISSDGTHTSLLPRPETPRQSPTVSSGGSPASSLQISLIGNLKTPSIKSPSPQSETNETVNHAIPRPPKPAPTWKDSALKPPPPSVKQPERPFPPKGVNNPRARPGVMAGISSVNPPAVAPALPPANPSSTARPLISSPVLDTTTSYTAKELIGGAVAPTRAAPPVPPPPVPPPPTRPTAIVDPLRHAPPPPKTPSDNGSSEKLAKDPGNYPTLTKIASILRPSASFRGRDDIEKKKREALGLKANKLTIDREKLRSLEISDPIPQKQIEVPGTAVPVQTAAVMRTQSMRSTDALAKRPNIQSFGSMRQPNRRPTSIAGQVQRPKSPPPPRPPPLPDVTADVASKEEESLSPKFPPDYSYDDCLNLIGEGQAPLAHIDEEATPTSDDNIYAVIEESPASGPSIATTEEEVVPSAGSSDSVGLLGEIVSAIQAKNNDSIYSTSTLARRRKEKEDAEKLGDAGTYMNTNARTPSSSASFTSLTSSNDYLSPSAVSPSSQSTKLDPLKSPSTTAPGTTTTTTTTSTAATVSRGPLAAASRSQTVNRVAPSPTPPSASSKPNSSKPNVLKSSTPAKPPVTASKPVTRGSTSLDRPALSKSPDVVPECDASLGDSKSPDILLRTGTKPATGKHSTSAFDSRPTKPIPPSQNSKPSISNKVTSDSKFSKSDNEQKLLSPHARAAASKVSVVASMQQKFESGANSNSRTSNSNVSKVHATPPTIAVKPKFTLKK